MKKRVAVGILAPIGVLLAFFAVYLAFRVSFRRPYRSTVEGGGIPSALVYAVIKAESGFREDAKSSAGAVGLMQIKPSTAEFICRRADISFYPTRLTEGEYNVTLGCLYLGYLFERFTQSTALAAYNAGEGTVREWLRDENYSSDGATLVHIPYPETENYVKKVLKFQKIYEILYR